MRSVKVGVWSKANLRGKPETKLKFVKTKPAETVSEDFKGLVQLDKSSIVLHTLTQLKRPWKAPMALTERVVKAILGQYEFGLRQLRKENGHMMTRATKEQEIKDITERFGKAKAAFLIDFKGMKVEQVTSLRKKLFPIKAEMKVVRNTLAKRALSGFPEAGEALNTSFKGTNAIVFAYEDASALAKTLDLFAKDVELLQLKTGVMDGKKLDAAKIKFLATLPSKDVMRAQFLGLLQAPGTKLARTLLEGPASLVRVLAAKKS